MVPGGSRYETDCVLVVGARGLIGGSADQLHFAYQPVLRDFRFRARLADWNGDAAESTVGLMLREGLEPSARQASILLKRVGDGLRHEFMRRRSRIGSARAGKSYDHRELWLELERVGDAVRGRVSEDGTNWTEADEIIFEGLSHELLVGVAAATAERDDEPASFCDLNLVSE